MCRPDPLLLIGRAGTGKTFLLNSISEALGLEHRPYNASLIAVDDLNDWVGFLKGHPQAQTPHMDRLAQRGLVFANAHCAAPLCCSSPRSPCALAAEVPSLRVLGRRSTRAGGRGEPTT